MATPIEAITSSFKKQLDGNLRMIHSKVWNLDIYYGPETIEARDRYLPLITERKTEGYAELLIARAKTVDGKPMFRPSDKLYFMKEADPDEVINIAKEIFLASFGSSELGAEDLGKS